MADVFAFLVANVEGILAVLFALHAFALTIVNLTPTPNEQAHAVLAKVYRGLEMVAGLISERAKDRG